MGRKEEWEMGGKDFPHFFNSTLTTDPHLQKPGSITVDRTICVIIIITICNIVNFFHSKLT